MPLLRNLEHQLKKYGSVDHDLLIKAGNCYKPLQGWNWYLVSRNTPEKSGFTKPKIYLLYFWKNILIDVFFLAQVIAGNKKTGKNGKRKPVFAAIMEKSRPAKESSSANILPNSNATLFHSHLGSITSVCRQRWTQTKCYLLFIWCKWAATSFDQWVKMENGFCT